MRRLLLIGLLLAAAAPTQAQSLEERLDLARTATKAKLALVEDEQLRTFDFETSLSAQGVLTITGRVPTAAHRARVEEVASGVDGVRAVVNSVTVDDTAGPNRPAIPPPVAPAPPAEAPAAPPAQQQGTPPPAQQQAAPAPAAAQPVYHTVRRGDTLGAIARRYGTSVRQIQQLNNLRGTTIRAGQRLRVK